MMKTGWWNVKFELTLEGEEVRWDDLDEATQEHIAECIKEGYTSGEIVIEDEEEANVEYEVKQYFNGIHWDSSYTTDRVEAEEWKAYTEDKSRSIWDRVNEDALIEFVKTYNIQCVEDIEVTVKIVEC